MSINECEKPLDKMLKKELIAKILHLNGDISGFQQAIKLVEMNPTLCFRSKSQ